MHPADQAVFARSDYRSAERAVAVETEFLRGLGASPAEAAAAVGTAEQWEKFTTIALPDRLLTDGELADVPGWKLRAVAHPRPHPRAPVFRGRAVAQAVLRVITCCPGSPPTSPSSAALLPDPLGDYLDSLARTRHLDVDEVLPAHEWRFRGLPGRVDAIAAHHERRLAELAGRDPPGVRAPPPGSWPGS